MTSAERHEARYRRRKAKRDQKKNKDLDDFDKVFTFEHLYASAEKCFKGVNWKESTQRFKANTTLNVGKLYKKLHDGTYKTKGFHEFDITERGKKRHIQSVHISERVVQKCLCEYSLIPILSRSLIYDNGATLKGKGIDFAIDRLKKHLKDHIKEHGIGGWVLRVDFKHYFENIDHEKLKDIIKSKYTDEQLIKLICTLIDNFKGDRGLGLGSQISQICALAYPNELDHIIKERLGIKAYGRYMDDLYLIHESKEKLKECLEVIKEFCDSHGIILNAGKTQISRLDRGVPFLKRRFIPTATGKIIVRPCMKNVYKMRRKLKTFETKIKNGEMTVKDVYASYTSWKSYISKTNCHFALRRTELQYQKIITGGQP